MAKTLVLMAALSISLSGTASAASYKLDDKGKCHDKQESSPSRGLCESHIFKMDKKGECRDERGRFADAKFRHA